MWGRVNFQRRGSNRSVGRLVTDTGYRARRQSRPSMVVIRLANPQHDRPIGQRVHVKTNHETSMKILQTYPPGPSGRDVARADIEVADGVRLFDVKIQRAIDGSNRVYARSASFSPDAVKDISDSVLSQMGRLPDANLR